MRLLLLLLSFLFVMDTNAQPRYEQIRDKDTKALVFKGQLGFEDLIKEPEFKWFNKGVDAYEPDEATIAYLRQHLKGYEIVTLIGTWCEDSHELVPKLYKVLKMANYTMKLHTLYALDLNKKGPFKGSGFTVQGYLNPEPRTPEPVNAYERKVALNLERLTIFRFSHNQKRAPGISYNL